MTYSQPIDPAFRMTKCSKTGCNNMQMYHTLFVFNTACRICRECYFKDIKNRRKGITA